MRACFNKTIFKKQVEDRVAITLWFASPRLNSGPGLLYRETMETH